MILRTALAVVLAVAAITASARPALGPGEAVYLVVLTDTATEPEISALGGRILESHAGRRLVVLPPAGVEALRQHSGVSYVQRIWMGEPGEPAVDAHEAPFEIVSAASAPPWSTGAYAYDPSGNIKSMGQDEFGYDRAGRLIQSKVSTQSQTFTYDQYGNLTKLGTRTITLDEENNNRLKGTGITYDATGNMTADGGGRAYHYDPLGMVTAINMTGDGTIGNLRMIYTADDERIIVIEPSVTRYRVRGFSGQLLREWTSSGTVLAWERDYLYAGGDLVAGEVQIDQRRNGQRHYHKDHLGSTRMVTDGARELVSLQNYLPFGTEITSTTAEFDNTAKAPRDPKKFTGHERDYFTLANAAGEYVDYMHARYYAPGWGRFLSVDPVLDIKEALHEPQLWNRYSYVTNNPLKFTDPDGRYRTFYKEKPMTVENLAMDDNTPAVVRGSVYAAGGLTALATGGLALRGAVSGSMAAYRTFQVWNTLRVAAAGGVALTGSTNDMARQAMRMTASLPGTAAQKAQLFQALATQISRASQGTWNAVRMGGANGEHVFAGRDRVLVITKDGNIFTGAANALKAATKDIVKIDYEKLKLLER
jgi:RHS repeat-associated protein